jgi:hypothetical protein
MRTKYTLNSLSFAVRLTVGFVGGLTGGYNGGFDMVEAP